MTNTSQMQQSEISVRRFGPDVAQIVVTVERGGVGRAMQLLERALPSLRAVVDVTPAESAAIGG